MIVVSFVRRVEAATEVISAWSYAGATSTTSAETRVNEARPRRISRSSREVGPPASGVPVPGAWGGVEDVDVDGDVEGAVADALAQLLGDLVAASADSLARRNSASRSSRPEISRETRRRKNRRPPASARSR